MAATEEAQATRSTKNGSTIIFTAPLHVQSDSENEAAMGDGQADKSQEYPANNFTDDEQANEIRTLKAKNDNLRNDYRILNGKYSLLVDRYNKLTRKMARKKASSMRKFHIRELANSSFHSLLERGK